MLPSSKVSLIVWIIGWCYQWIYLWLTGGDSPLDFGHWYLWHTTLKKITVDQIVRFHLNTCHQGQLVSNIFLLERDSELWLNFISLVFLFLVLRIYFPLYECLFLSFVILFQPSSLCAVHSCIYWHLVDFYQFCMVSFLENLFMIHWNVNNVVQFAFLYPMDICSEYC